MVGMYVDDLAIVMDNPQEFLTQLSQNLTRTLNEKGQDQWTTTWDVVLEEVNMVCSILTQQNTWTRW